MPALIKFETNVELEKNIIAQINALFEKENELIERIEKAEKEKKDIEKLNEALILMREENKEKYQDILTVEAWLSIKSDKLKKLIADSVPGFINIAQIIRDLEANKESNTQKTTTTSIDNNSMDTNVHVDEKDLSLVVRGLDLETGVIKGKKKEKTQADYLDLAESTKGKNVNKKEMTREELVKELRDFSKKLNKKGKSSLTVINEKGEKEINRNVITKDFENKSIELNKFNPKPKQETGEKRFEEEELKKTGKKIGFRKNREL